MANEVSFPVATQELLLVERDPKARRVLKLGLQQAGYRVSTAQDGAAALLKLERSIPALVVASTDLPGVDGYALVRRLRDDEQWADIPVIFMVAAHSIEDKIRGLELGVEEYLDKPVFLKELQARVQVLLAKRVRRDLSDTALTTSVRGSLADIAPIDLLESLEVGQQSGVLKLQSGSKRGSVWFRNGNVLDAELGELRGEEAFFRMLGFVHGSFEVGRLEGAITPTISAGTRALIDAGVSHLAELNGMLGRLPAAGSCLSVDVSELARRMGGAPEALLPLLELLDGSRDVYEVLDVSPFDDLSTLDTLEQLRAEGLLQSAPLHPAGTAAREQPDSADEVSTRRSSPPPAAAPARRREPEPAPESEPSPPPPSEPVPATGPTAGPDDAAPISSSPAAPSSKPDLPPTRREVALRAQQAAEAAEAAARQLAAAEPAPVQADEPEPTPASPEPSHALSDATDEPPAGAMEDSTPPPNSDGSGFLSESGVSESFFASEPPPEPVEHDADDDDWTDSGPAPSFLTPEQRARQERSRRLVMLLVGGLGLAVFAAIVRAAFSGDDDPPEQPSSALTSTATSTPTSTAMATATAAPTASATAEPSVEPSASASAAPPDPALPQVDNPLEEAKKFLNIGRYQDAVPMARAAIAKNPEDGDAYFYLATALQSMGKNDEAKKVYGDCVATAKTGQYLSYCKMYAPK